MILANKSPQTPVLRLTRAIFLLCCFFIAPVGFSSNSDPHVWLERMNDAVEFLNYQGTLVRMRGEQADTFRVYHRVVDGVVTERLVAMDGEGTEIIRDQDEVTCIFPGQKTLMVEKRGGRSHEQSPLTASLPTYSEALEAHYEFSLLEEGRTAGRSARILQIRPLDGLRYGYRLWLDIETAMPLKSQLRSETGGELLEEILFADISLLEVVPASSVMSTVSTENFTRISNDGSRPAAPYQPDEMIWRAAQLPAGFMMTSGYVEYMENSVAPRIHIIYMDGLASVSVFIDPAVAASDQLEGASAMGVANAYSRVDQGQLITAVGQVPAETVKIIASSMEYVSLASAE
jgi:sigma-E factor negative regulatory protein RseB